MSYIYVCCIHLLHIRLLHTFATYFFDTYICYIRLLHTFATCTFTTYVCYIRLPHVCYIRLPHIRLLYTFAAYLHLYLFIIPIYLFIILTLMPNQRSYELLIDAHLCTYGNVLAQCMHAMVDLEKFGGENVADFEKYGAHWPAEGPSFEGLILKNVC